MQHSGERLLACSLNTAAVDLDWRLNMRVCLMVARERLRLRPGDHPMLLAEPSDNEKAAREKTVEVWKLSCGNN